MRWRWGQVSLAYLFAEVALFAVVFALMRLHPWRPPPTPAWWLAGSLGCFALGFFLSAAIGGLFNRMALGAKVGIVIGIVFGLPLLILSITGPV